MPFEMSPIGTIFTPHKDKKSCPIQPAAAGDVQGTVEILPEYAEGLKDIDLFSHIYLLYLLDRAGEIQFVRPTFLDDNPHGIYASRHPARPNSIGLSVVRLKSRKGRILHIEGVDMLDNTPLLDIKPYLSKFDLFPEASNGWVKDKPLRPKPEGRE